jgi:hypothetical protein
MSDLEAQSGRPQSSKADTTSELRERIILILGNALYVGKSIEQISKITKKELQPFEDATDSIMQLIAARDRRLELEAQLKEVNRLNESMVNSTGFNPEDKYRIFLYCNKRVEELTDALGSTDKEAGNAK